MNDLRTRVDRYRLDSVTRRLTLSRRRGLGCVEKQCELRTDDLADGVDEERRRHQRDHAEWGKNGHHQHVSWWTGDWFCRFTARFIHHTPGIDTLTHLGQPETPSAARDPHSR